MSNSRRHRTQRERAALHFLNNISLDGADVTKKPFVPEDPCYCEKCKRCLVPNENFSGPYQSK